MQWNMPLVTADTAKAEYFKAHATIEDELVLLRNLVGTVLEVINLDEVVSFRETDTGKVWVGTSDGNPVVVRELLGECQCGGTRVTPKPQADQ